MISGLPVFVGVWKYDSQERRSAAGELEKKLCCVVRLDRMSADPPPEHMCNDWRSDNHTQAHAARNANALDGGCVMWDVGQCVEVRPAPLQLLKENFIGPCRSFNRVAKDTGANLDSLSLSVGVRAEDLLLCRLPSRSIDRLLGSSADGLQLCTPKSYCTFAG